MPRVVCVFLCVTLGLMETSGFAQLQLKSPAIGKIKPPKTINLPTVTIENQTDYPITMQINGDNPLPNNRQYLMPGQSFSRISLFPQRLHAFAASLRSQNVYGVDFPVYEYVVDFNRTTPRILLQRPNLMSLLTDFSSSGYRIWEGWSSGYPIYLEMRSNGRCSVLFFDGSVFDGTVTQMSRSTARASRTFRIRWDGLPASQDNFGEFFLGPVPGFDLDIGLQSTLIPFRY